MRLNSIILITAFFLIAVTAGFSQKYLPGYNSSDEFLKTIYVEVLSFIVTAAVIGAASGILLHYLSEREKKPLRSFVSTQADEYLTAILSSLIKILNAGVPLRNHYDDYYVVSGDAKLLCYRRRTYSFLPGQLSDLDEARTKLLNLFNRYSSIFPASVQDDILKLEAQLEQMDRALSVIRYHLPFSPDTHIQIGVDTLLQALERFGVDGLSNVENKGAVKLALAQDAPAEFSMLGPNNSKKGAGWKQFFDAFEIVFEPYYKGAASYGAKYSKHIHLLENMWSMSARVVLYSDMPVLVPEHTFTDYFAIMDEVDFSAEDLDAEARVMARVPKGLFVADDGVFEIGGIAQLPHGEDILKKIASAYVKESHRTEFENLVANTVFR